MKAGKGKIIKELRNALESDENAFYPDCDDDFTDV